MAEKPQPKKKRKVEKLHLNVRKKWEALIKDVEKNEVPVGILDTINITLIDGTSIILDIKQLIALGDSPDDIEEMLNEKFEELDDYIVNVDFHVDINQVVNTIQPETDRILKNL
jgi:hypothetical protein